MKERSQAEVRLGFLLFFLSKVAIIHFFRHGISVIAPIWIRLLSFLVLTFVSPRLFAIDQRCAFLAETTQQLLDHSIYCASKDSLYQPEFNQAVFDSFLYRFDPHKKFYLQSHVKKMVPLRRKNIARLIPKHQKKSDQHKPDCTFVEESYRLFQKTLPFLRESVYTHIRNDPSFEESETLNLLMANNHFAHSYEELSKKWSHRIQLDKLALSFQLFPSLLKENLYTEELKHELWRRYKNFFRSWDLDNFYRAWQDAMFTVIDKKASRLYDKSSNFSDFNYYAKLSPLSPYIKPINASLIPKNLRGDPPRTGPQQFLRLALGRIYPMGLTFDFIKDSSYILGMKTRQRTRHLPAPSRNPAISRSQSLEHFDYETLVLESHQGSLRYAKKALVKGTSLFSLSHPSALVIRMKSSEEPSEAPHKVLWLQAHSLIKARHPLREQVSQFQVFYSKWLPRWKKHSDVIVLDLRNSQTYHEYNRDMTPYFAGLFGDKLPLFQLLFAHKQHPKMSVFSKVYEGLESSSFEEDKPLVILLNDKTTGLLETVAHALRIMNRAVIVGTGPSGFTSGKVHYTNTNRFNRAALIYDDQNLHYTLRYSYGLVYHIDGSLQTNMGRSYDIYLDGEQPIDGSTVAMQVHPGYPWQHLDQQSSFYQKTESLSYPNFQMISPSLIKTLHDLRKHRHQRQQSLQGKTLQRVKPSYSSSGLTEGEVSLKWSDYRDQIVASQDTIERREEQLRILRQERLDAYDSKLKDNPIGIEILAEDPSLMETLQIASQYFYLLKKNRRSGEFSVTGFVDLHFSH